MAHRTVNTLRHACCFAICLTAVAVTCCCPSRVTPPARTPSARTEAADVSAKPAAPTSVDPFERRAAWFIARARANEPQLTPLLLQIAKATGAEMYKLDFRLKTKASAERKIRKLAGQHSLAPALVKLDDALRYTLRVDDVPPGRYIETVKAALTQLESHGHQVVLLKNYWPTDDNYSGINGVLKAPDGLEWELQFHTSESIRAQGKTRPMYERMRRQDTPLDRQRQLFDDMTAIWAAVPVPHGVLVQGALHPASEIRHRPRP